MAIVGEEFSPKTNEPTVATESLPMGMLPSFHAREDAHRPMISFNGRTVSRGELEANANRRARAFAQMGVTTDDFVTIAFELDRVL
jgi:hypothetical protein